MWELDYKESWAPKNWCFWTVVLEKTLESLLDCKEIQPVHPKGNQFWISIGSTNAEGEAPILGPPDAKSWLIWKDLDAGKDWRWEEKWMTEDELVGWYHWLNGHEFGQAPGVGDGKEGLVSSSPWGPQESDMTEQLNWTELEVKKVICSIAEGRIVFHRESGRVSRGQLQEILQCWLGSREQNNVEAWEVHSKTPWRDAEAIK